MLGFAERIDEIGDEIFFFGASFEDFLFVFDDDFVVGDFDDFLTRNDELGVDDALDDGTFDDDLSDEEVVGINGKVNDLAEFGAFFGLDFEGEEVEIEIQNLFDLDDFGWGDELVDVVDDDAVV